jgi:octaprenyl-diphosphate synthase
MLVAENSPTAVASPDNRADVPDWRRIVRPVEPFLAQVSACLAEQISHFEPEIAEYARYALTNQGKQLRPALVALSGQAVGRLNDGHVRVAAIIEMVHLATLVHDDIMDGAELRRRRPTLAVHWGNEVSVLLGDCLFAHALEMAASFPTPDVCRAVSRATKTVCTGEILQTQRRGRLDLERAEYVKLLEMKTAELFALSCELGGALAGATPAEGASLRDYGLALGTAYQIYDDCVDLFGREEQAGKSLGTDLAKGKLTLPVLVAIERSTPAECRKFHQMIHPWSAAHLPEILNWLHRHDALAESRAVIHRYLETTGLALRQLPASPGRAALERLAALVGWQAAALGDSTVQPRE